MRNAVFVSVLSLLYALAFCEEKTPLMSAELLTTAESNEIEAYKKALFAAGFPDTTKAVVYSGPLRVKATFDPAKETPLPSSASTMQETGSTPLTTYGYEFKGLHFKLVDGSWVIALAY